MPDLPETPATGGRPDGPGVELDALALCAGLPDGELEDLAARADISWAHPGQVIQAQDVPVRFWHVIVAGHAVVHRDGTPIGLLVRGDSWSEPSLLGQLHSPIEVVALSPLTLVTLRASPFLAVLERSPVLAQRLAARASTSWHAPVPPTPLTAAHRSDPGR